MKKTIFYALLLGILLGLLETASFFGLYVLKNFRKIDYAPIAYPVEERNKKILDEYLDGKFNYTVHDADLGWTIRPSSEGQKLYRANSQGLRGDREYPVEKAEGKIRIAAFGDSFTHSDDVSNPETWQALMEAMDPSLEVMNFGVGGYGVDQAFLRYRKEGKEFSPDIVLIGYMSENIFRSINTFRPFYRPKSGIILGKPRFKIENGGLKEIPNPTPDTQTIKALARGDASLYRELKAHDGYESWRYKKGRFDFLASVRLFKIVRNELIERLQKDGVLRNGEYNREGEAYRVTLRIIQEFYAEAIRNGAAPVVVVFATKEDTARYRKTGRASHGPLLEDMRKQGLRFIDLAPVLAEYDGSLDELFKGHHTPKGNGVAAGAIYDYLRKQELLPSRRDA